MAAPHTRRGTYVTMSQGGFVYRRRERDLPADARLVAQSQGDIRTASVETLSPSSPEWFVTDAQHRLTKGNLFKAYCWVATLLTFVGLIASGAFGVFLAIALTGGGIFVQRWDRERRTSRIVYDTSNPEIAERIAMAVSAAQWLGGCESLWHIFHAVQTSDWKRNAGAGTLIRRTLTRCSAGALPSFEVNVQTWCVPVGPQQVLFLPDRLLVWDGTHLVALPYDQISVRSSSTRFIEEGNVPRDGHQVGATWRFVCKDGTPDLRFNNNAKLAIMEYGELELRSHRGLVVVLQSSTTRAAEGAAQALAALAKRAQRVATTSATRPNQSAALAPDPVSSPSHAQDENTLLMRARSVAVLLKCIAAADRRVDVEEVTFASNVIAQLLPAGHPDLEQLLLAFRALPTSKEIVSEALRVVADAGSDYGRWVMDALHRMAQADGKLTPNEAERLSEFRLSLDI